MNSCLTMCLKLWSFVSSFYRIDFQISIQTWTCSHRTWNFYKSKFRPWTKKIKPKTSRVQPWRQSSTALIGTCKGSISLIWGHSSCKPELQLKLCMASLVCGIRTRAWVLLSCSVPIPLPCSAAPLPCPSAKPIKWRARSLSISILEFAYLCQGCCDGMGKTRCYILSRMEML